VLEEGAVPALGELHAPHGLRGFKNSGAVSLALGVGGSFTFGDSPPVGTLFAGDSGLISWGTLHRGSQVTN
jgi:hypothetical protein